MKKYLFTLLMCMMLYVLAPATKSLANDYWIDYDNLYSYSENRDGTITITGINATGYIDQIIITDPVIPEEINGKSVTAIKARAFSAFNLTGTLTIPGTINTIGEEAFYQCYGIDTIVNNSYVDIYLDQFRERDSNFHYLENTEFYDAHIGSRVLMQYVNNGTYCKPRVYEQFKYINSISGITILGLTDRNAIIKNPIIPSTIEGKTVQAIDTEAFSNCTNLSGNLTISEGIKYIGGKAFGYCSGITGTIYILGNDTQIGNSAFYKCYEAEEIVNYSDSKLSASDFLNNTDEFFLDTNGNAINQNDQIGKGTYKRFSASNVYVHEDYTYRIINDGSIFITGLKDELTVVHNPVIPSKIGDFNVSGIDNEAFSGCKRLVGTLTLATSIKVIGNKAFYGCSRLSGTLTIPYGVESIGAYAFSGCNGIRGPLTIPSSVCSIGASVFSGCSGLTGSLEIPSSITCISEGSFSGCSGLNGTLTIPNSVKEIGAYAFSGCNGLSGTLFIPDCVNKIGECAFSGCSGFTGSLKIPSSLASISAGTFSECSALNGTLTIPNGVNEIGACAFSGCDSIRGSLIIPDSVRKIDTSAFSNCSGFTKLSISNNLLEIESEVFYGCCGLEDVSIPNGVLGIGEKAFSKCGDSLETITISSSVVEIAESAFEGCFSVKSVTNNSNVNIHASCFLNDEGESLRGEKTSVYVSLSGMLGKDSYIRCRTVSKIIIDRSSVCIDVGETASINVTLYPIGATDRPVIWTSTNEEIATVNSDGVLTGIKAGTANITAECYGIKAACVVTVKNPVIEVTSVTLDKTTTTIETGNTLSLMLTFSPDNVTNKGVTWSSSDSRIAAVSSNGRIRGIKAGTALITVTSNSGNKKATCKVTVIDTAPVKKSIATATVSGLKGKTYTGKALTQSVEVTLNDKALKSGTDYSLSYENNVNAGTATVTIKGIGSYTGSLKKTFTIAKSKQTITASDVTKTTANAAFSLGAKTNGKGQLSYKSGNTKVVTVDTAGKVSIKGVGKTTITITASATGNYKQATKTINVTVTAPAKKSIAKATITGLKDKTYTGKALKQNPTVKLSGKKLKAGTDYTVSYKNNKNAGTATITITGKGNYKGTATATFKIKKAANSLKVKANKTTYNITYSKLSKKNQGIEGTQIYNVTKPGQGELSYALSAAKNGKKSVKTSFSVNKKTGKLTVKKGLKKGTYSVEIGVTAAGDKNHNKITKKIKISVIVK